MGQRRWARHRILQDRTTIQVKLRIFEKSLSEMKHLFLFLNSAGISRNCTLTFLLWKPQRLWRCQNATSLAVTSNINLGTWTKETSNWRHCPRTTWPLPSCPPPREHRSRRKFFSTPSPPCWQSLEEPLDSFWDSPSWLSGMELRAWLLGSNGWSRLFSKVITKRELHAVTKF